MYITHKEEVTTQCIDHHAGKANKNYVTNLAKAPIYLLTARSKLKIACDLVT
jgi:hypothetical protein